MVVGAEPRQRLTERAVAEADLQQSPPVYRRAREVVEEVRVEREARFVEACQRLFRGIADAECARQVRAPQLVSQGRVAVVERGFADHGNSVQPAPQPFAAVGAARVPRLPLTLSLIHI